MASALAQTGLFGHLDPAVLEQVAACMVTRRYPKGAHLFLQGDPADRAYVLAEGRVTLAVTSDAGDEMVLSSIEAPGAFGEEAFADSGPRICSARAASAVEAHSLHRADYHELLRFHPNLADGLIRVLAANLREATERSCDFVFLDLAGRVAKAIMALAQGQPDDGCPTVVLPMSQNDLARMVGGSRQTVNQILRCFERRGLVTATGRVLQVHGPDRLRRQAGLRATG